MVDFIFLKMIRNEYSKFEKWLIIRNWRAGHFYSKEGRSSECGYLQKREPKGRFIFMEGTRWFENYLEIC